MTQYISKDALVAEIEKILYASNLEADIASTGDCFNEEVAEAKYKLCKYIIDKINTLEVKEVDLEKEIDNQIRLLNGVHTMESGTNWYEGPYSELVFFAKYFFELGLKAQKGE